MAVGVIEEENPRYFSIVRWGDAKLTLAQVKRRLWVEKWLLLLTATGGNRFSHCNVGCHALWRIEILSLLPLDETYWGIPLQPTWASS
jgi:hypothetical protein